MSSSILAGGGNHEEEEPHLKFHKQFLSLFGNHYHLGLFIDDNRAVLVEVDLSQAAPTVVRVDALSLAPGESEQNAATLRHLLKEMKFRARSVSVALPHRWGVVKSLRVPSADPSEIRSMAMLQACRLMPFSPEEIVAGFETVETSTEGYSQVLLTVVRREDVASVLDVCRGAGLRVIKILFDTHALPALVADRVGSPRLLINAEAGEGMVVVLDKNKARFARTFPWDGTPTSLTRETMSSVEAYRTETPFWAPTKILWIGSAPRAEIREGLESALDAPLEPVRVSGPLEEAMARNAYAAACATKAETNLLPDTEQKVQADENKSRQQKIFAVLALALVLSVGGLGWDSLRRQEQKISALDREGASLTHQAEGLEAKASRLEEAQRSDDGAALLEIFRVLNKGLPSGLSLSGFSYQRQGAVVLQGESLSLAMALSAVSALERTGFFQTVELKNSDAATINGKEIVQFQIVCETSRGKK